MGSSIETDFDKWLLLDLLLHKMWIGLKIIKGPP